MTTSTSETLPTIIGISGLQRSGKDTLAELLIKDGYFGVSFGDIVRDESRKRHADTSDPISVANLTETSNWLRTEHGADVLLNLALETFERERRRNPYKGLVLYSIRAPIEVDWILTHGGKLVWVEASDDIRYTRFVDHLRDGEKVISQAAYLQQEALQWKPQPNVSKEVQMDMAYVKEHATLVLENNGNDLDEFFTQAKKRLAVQ